jgi:hypothetical protein
MCGRYVRRSDKPKIAELFAIHGPVLPDLRPSWNVAPQTFQPVVRLNRDTGEREFVLMRWGLVPYWIALANSAGAAEVSAIGGEQLQLGTHRRGGRSCVLRGQRFRGSGRREESFAAGVAESWLRKLGDLRAPKAPGPTIVTQKLTFQARCRITSG